MGPAFTVILAAALTHGRGPISRSRMCSMNLSDDLKKAEATLKGLLQDGFGPEALRPLESKINTLRARVDAEKSMPPLKSVQRKIWDLGYVIEDEESRNDSDTPARLTVMRGERRYLLEKLLRDDGAAYVDFLNLLSGKGLTENDFPSLNGIPMVSADAVEQGLSAEAAEAVRRQAVQDARRAQVEAAEAAAASSERANEAASSTFAEIDLTFATCFISSEEARFDMTPKVAGKGMWTAELQLLRLKTFRAFLNVLIFQGAALDAALSELAMADVLRKAFEFEIREQKRNEEYVVVTERARGAWQNRAAFIREWKDRSPVSYLPSEPSYNGMSAVGRLRARQTYERELAGEKSDGTAEKLNAWFNEFLDKMP